MSIESTTTPLVLADTDVVSSSGRVSTEFSDHPGNIRFRAIVASKVQAYECATSKRLKTVVINSIMKEVHSYGARFLIASCSDGQHQTLALASKRKITDKISHSLRRETRTVRKQRLASRGKHSKANKEVVNALSMQPSTCEATISQPLDECQPVQVPSSSLDECQPVQVPSSSFGHRVPSSEHLNIFSHAISPTPMALVRKVTLDHQDEELRDESTDSHVDDCLKIWAQTSKSVELLCHHI